MLLVEQNPGGLAPPLPTDSRTLMAAGLSGRATVVHSSPQRTCAPVISHWNTPNWYPRGSPRSTGISSAACPEIALILNWWSRADPIDDAASVPSDYFQSTSAHLLGTKRTFEVAISI
jgi:hypothetical protein